MATAKRVRPDSPDECDWCIEFSDITSFRSIVEMSAGVMQRVLFRVKESDEQYTMMVDGADLGFSCCIVARLNVVMKYVSEDMKQQAAGSGFTFCVDAKHVLWMLESAASCTVELRGLVEKASVEIRLSDPSHPDHDESGRLDTYVQEDTTTNLQGMEYEYQVTFATSKVKDLLRRGRKAHAELFVLSISTVARGPNKESAVVTLKVNGDIEFQQTFWFAVGKKMDGSIMIMETPSKEYSTDKYNEIFRNSFPLSKIDAFVRCRSDHHRHPRQGRAHDDAILLQGESIETCCIRFLVQPCGTRLKPSPRPRGRCTRPRHASVSLQRVQGGFFWRRARGLF